MNNQQIIPVMTTFDNNYSAPAAVCFYSLLKNSNKDYQYNLYVLNTDITEENKVKLRKTIANFPNAKLEFINMQGKFEDLFKNTKSKGHYTKEMYYKFLAPSIFPQYEKIIITDVDVVFMSDISQIYNDFSVEENLYLYGHRLPDRKDNWTEKFLEKTYEKEWTFEEYSKLNISAGFLVFNLKKMREDDLETKFVDFAMKNAYRIKQPEQDTINFICYPLIKYMPFRAVFCSYLYDVYKIAEDFSKSLVYSALEIKQTFENSPPPIQFHYATSVKPWLYPDSVKSEYWFEYLKYTPFYMDVLKTFVGKDERKNKKIAKISLKKIKIIVEAK